MKNYNYHLIGLILLLLFGCTEKEMNRKELQVFLQNEKNGVKKVFDNKDGLKIEVYALRPELVFPANGKSTLGKSGDSLIYFMVSFSKDGKEALAQSESFDQYAGLLRNLSFNAGDYCFLIKDNKDTLALNNSYFSNTYGTGAANNLYLVYNNKTEVADYKLVLTEFGFGIGKREFVFEQRNINKFNKIHVIN